MVFHVGGYYSTSSVVLCPPKNFKLKLLNYASQLKALFYGSTESSRLRSSFFLAMITFFASATWRESFL